jgi:hypothetical protein
MITGKPSSPMKDKNFMESSPLNKFSPKYESTRSELPLAALPLAILVNSTDWTTDASGSELPGVLSLRSK